MGSAGALAAHTGVEVTLATFPTYLQQGMEPVLALKAALETAHGEIVKLSGVNPGIATTCVATLLTGNQAILAHVGDSRAYLVRSGQPLSLLTTDHSWTEEFGRRLVRQGLLTSKELQRDNRRHAITRAMGMQEEFSFDFNCQFLLPGDRILLCTDGLWDLVEADTLHRLASQNQGVQNEDALVGAAHQLVEAALAQGGRDNITLTLIEVDDVGQPTHLPALKSLVEDTERATASRTGTEDNKSRIEDEPITEETPLLISSDPTEPAMPYSLAEPDEIISIPAHSHINLNEDTLFLKVQKLYALGDFEEAVPLLIQLEQVNSERNGLYEMMSISLVRVIGAAVVRGDAEKAQNLLAELEQANIVRYHETLFDFCHQESMEAEELRNYTAIRDYAMLALRLRPADVRLRNLQEMSEAYLTFQDPSLSLEDRLNRGQNLYARDPNFGGIQDDLALIYLELGDSELEDGAEEDALGWYQLVRGLRLRDSRLYSLALGKQRSIEDTIQRRNEQASDDLGLIQPASTDNSETVASNATEVKPDLETINRLRERVSRTQKAWDNGRREVGSEYIYLVEQLNQHLSPNPWQSTFPRVCYDYAKWLFDQHQYKEAKPFFIKAAML